MNVKLLISRTNQWAAELRFELYMLNVYYVLFDKITQDERLTSFPKSTQSV